MTIYKKTVDNILTGDIEKTTKVGNPVVLDLNKRVKKLL